MIQDKGVASSETAEFEKLIETARIRSKKIRIITLLLILGLICIGIFLTVNSMHHREAELRREAQLKATAEAQRAEQEKLIKAAQDAQRIAGYLASGANKAGHAGRVNRQAALEEYDKALAVQPDNADALSLKGYLKLRMGEEKEAKDLLGKAVQYGPSNPWNHYNFALALWANGNKDEAIAQLQAVLTLDKSFKSYLMTDPQFRSFNSDARFRAMLK